VPPSSSRTALCMGKGFRRMQKRREDLEQDLEEARRQRLEQEGKDETSGLTEEEIKERNDRKRFEELLNQGTFALDEDYDDNAYLNEAQEEKLALTSHDADILFEEDPAPTQCFEELVHIKTGNAIGDAGRLVPWLHKSPARHNDFLIIVCHPNQKDMDMRKAMKELNRNVPAEVKKRLMFVNADTPAENRRWLKRNGLLDEIVVYSDEKLNWMRSYSAVGNKYAYMTFFIIAKGRVKKILREASVSDAHLKIKAMIKSMLADPTWKR